MYSFMQLLQSEKTFKKSVDSCLQVCYYCLVGKGNAKPQNLKRKEDKKMKFKVILKRYEKNLLEGATFFKTKKEATQYASQFSDSIIKRKIGANWIECK